MLKNTIEDTTQEYKKESQDLLWPITGESLEKQYLEIVLSIKHPFAEYKLSRSMQKREPVIESDSMNDFTEDLELENRTEPSVFTENNALLNEDHEEESDSSGFMEDLNTLQQENKGRDISSLFSPTTDTDSEFITDADMNDQIDVEADNYMTDENELQKNSEFEDIPDYSSEEMTGEIYKELQSQESEEKESFLRDDYEKEDDSIDEGIKDSSLSFLEMNNTFDVKDEDHFDEMEMGKNDFEVDFDSIEEDNRIVGEEIPETNEIHESIEKISTMQQDVSTEDENMFVNKNELLELLLYIDMIMRDLPESTREDFEKSKYYVLYNRLFDELGI